MADGAAEGHQGGGDGEMNKVIYLYVCDRKKDCNWSALCGVECNHTKDRRHALYSDGSRTWDYVPVGAYFERTRETSDGGPG